MNVLDQCIRYRYAIYQGDCVAVTQGLPDNSIHYCVFSPPFASLYTYSNSDRDMGNSSSDDEFMQTFAYLIEQLYRVIIPGRLVSIHCMNLPAMKSRDGFIGIKDFRGDIIREMEAHGFIFHSEVCIWKNPVTEMQRTKALGLLHKQIKKDSSLCRNGIPDYVVTFRKPGENPEPIAHDDESFPVDVWQRYASPVWDDIRQSNTLQRISARDEKDEKHICPLQLDVIERCINLWTNPGDIVLDPFAGIGSVPYQAVIMGRRGLGIELKESYYIQARNNLAMAAHQYEMEGSDPAVHMYCPVCGKPLVHMACADCSIDLNETAATMRNRDPNQLDIFQFV